MILIVRDGPGHVESPGKRRRDSVCATSRRIRSIDENRGNHVVRFEQLENRTFLTIVPSGFTDTVLGGTSALDRPVAMEFAPDGRIFVTEQAGTLRVIKDGRSCRRRSRR